MSFSPRIRFIVAECVRKMVPLYLIFAFVQFVVIFQGTMDTRIALYFLLMFVFWMAVGYIFASWAWKKKNTQ